MTKTYSERKSNKTQRRTDRISVRPCYLINATLSNNSSPLRTFSPPSDYIVAPPSTPIESPPITPLAPQTFSSSELLTTLKTTPPPLAPTQPSKQSSPLAINLEPLELVFTTPPTSPYSYFDSLEDLPPRSTNPPPLPSFESINVSYIKTQLIQEPEPKQIRITPNPDQIKDRPTFVSTDWRIGDPTLRTLPKSRMTKQGNFTQRTPQAKKQSDQASRQVSKQASGSTNTPYDLVFPAMGPSLGTTQPTATITSTEDLQRATFTTPPQTAPGTNTTEPPPLPIRNKGPELGADNLTLEGVATELAPSDFARLNFGPEDEVSPPRHRKERRGKDNRRPPVFGRIGKQVSGTQTANLQNLDTHENNDRRISVRDRLGSRDVHSRLGQWRSPSESPPSSDSEDSRRKRRRRVSSSSEDTSDNEDAETGHWKSKNKYRGEEDEDMSRPWRRQKVDAFTRRISDFSEDKKRRMPANVKTYDGTVRNARTVQQKLPSRSIVGFEELRRAFRLNFTQRKKCAKNPVELARVKQRQGESTSAYVERYKDECIHVKACPEILKISGFMNGINNPELIKRLNDRVPQTFDELMKRTRNSPETRPITSSSSRNNSYRGQRGGRGNDKYTPLTMTPKEILATEGSNFPKPPPMRTPEEQRVGNGYCEYHRQKGHTTNECVQLRQLIDKLVKEGRLDHLVKNIKEGKDKQRSESRKTH
ncbi:hypothetical protein Tco_1516045 [Tanacetum coccineum]